MLEDVEVRISIQRAEQRSKYRAINLKLRYGITPEEYDELLVSQNGVCAICGEECSTGRRLSVDHDHETGRVRGLLCSKCNYGIGHLKTVENLERAIDYLENKSI
jgi:hypothetical protein